MSTLRTTTTVTTVKACALSASSQNLHHYTLTYQQLLKDVHTAYYEARRNKRNKAYQLRFEANLENNLSSLAFELWTRSYRPNPSSCFLITDPKKREVFAADFRDRIVHHLYYSYVSEMLQRTFIQDSYSCIKKRGTHYGIHRLEQHIRQESQNYQERCYILKMDLKGYFMHINRNRLLEITLKAIDRMSRHRVNVNLPLCWKDVIDIDFVNYLTREIVLLDPTVDCHINGKEEDWQTLPHSKSLFHSPQDCGLPIGNLTSQLFSNVYMNEFDQWMKREMHCRHYGRYVDDFFVVSCDREWLKSLIPQVRRFLCDSLGLSLQEGKTMVCDARYGVEYLGAYLKPWRSYVANKTLKHINKKILALEHILPYPDLEHLRSSLSSILGLMRQHNSWNLRQSLVLGRLQPFTRYGRFDNALTKFSSYALAL